MLGMPPYWRPSNRFCTARVASFPYLKGECNDASPKSRLFALWTAGELFVPHIKLFDLTAIQLFDLNVIELFAPIAEDFLLSCSKAVCPEGERAICPNCQRVTCPNRLISTCP
jgi:hypothetical protein